MLKRTWPRWAAMFASGALLLQVPACSQYLATAADIGMLITTGGVIYIVSRVLE